MPRKISLLLTTFLLFVCYSTHGEEAAIDSQRADESSGSDQRRLISMPDQARQVMREHMLDHLAALNEIIAHLAASEFDAAAQVAEERLGWSSMGKHRGTGMGPGRFMPSEMRNIGRGMHESASEFSRIAKEGDPKSAYAALQKVTAACVACHYSYRTR